MSWVGRALSSVTQYYKEINPSTLSGAIDVVVVERKIPSASADGSFETYSEETELACTPFHVRFGKLSVLRPSDRRVVVRVNGKEVPLAMKVGETGEAFFVFETEDADLPENMQTSPLARPINPGLQDEQEPEPLELGEAVSSSSDPRQQREYDKDTKPQRESGKDLADASQGGTSLANKAAATVTQLGTASASEVRHLISEAVHSSHGEATPPEADEDGPPSPTSQEVQRLEQRMQDQMHISSNPDAVGLAHEPGQDSIEAARQDRLEGPPLAARPSIQSNKSMRSVRRELMLDMEGYKVGDEDQSRAKAIENHLLSSELAGDRLSEDVVLFTQSLLRSADLEKSRHGAEALERYHLPKPSRSSAVATPSPLSTSPRSDTFIPRASSPAPSIADFTVSPVTSSNTTFSVSADGTSHTFELALCPRSIGNALEEAQAGPIDEAEFDRNRITIEGLRENANLVNDRNLVCRFDGKFLTWENASPVLASLGIYQDAMANSPSDYTDDSADASRSGTPPAAPPPASSRRWSSWWSGSSSKPKQGDAQPTTRPRTMSATSGGGGRASRASSPEPFQGSVNDRTVRATSPEPEALSEEDEQGYESDERQQPQAGPSSSRNNSGRHYAKTLRLTSDQLKQLNLKKGRNDVSFSVMSSYSSNVVKCTSRIFLWDHDYKVVISDIDGTITKSDALGHVFAMIGRDWTHHGVAKLYTDIARNGYKLLYLTSRAIGQADTTREYLRGINQHSFVLPEGPVIMSPDRLMTSLHREVIARKPEVFKMACLQDVQSVFAAKPFYAGFGNRITDALSYRTVDIPSARIFTIDSNGDVRMELLELAGYKSSYIAMTDLVDQMFPPVNREASPEFSDFNYWRPTLPKVDLPDLTPTSPQSRAYSIRRITSSLSRRGAAEQGAIAPTSRTATSKPTSPLQAAHVAEEEPDQLDLEAQASPSPRRHRTGSMPGSLEEEGAWPRHLKEELKKGSTPADARDQLRRSAMINEAEEAPEADDEDDDGFPMDDMDFSSVPY